MLIGLRNAMMAGKRLPYDAEVEYIEANPVGPFLVLPPVPQQCAFDFKIKIYPISAGTVEFAGCKKVSGGSLFQFVFSYGILDYPTSNFYRRVTFASLANREWAELEVNGTSFVKDGTTIKSNFNNNFTLGWQISGVGLFGTCNENRSYHSRAAARVAYFRYSADGKVVFDGIPVRFTNEQGVSEGAMFDRANPTVGMNPDGSARTDGLYRNCGTGAFIIGPDI